MYNEHFTFFKLFLRYNIIILNFPRTQRNRIGFCFMTYIILYTVAKPSRKYFVLNEFLCVINLAVGNLSVSKLIL